MFQKSKTLCSGDKSLKPRKTYLVSYRPRLAESILTLFPKEKIVIKRWPRSQTLISMHLSQAMNSHKGLIIQIKIKIWTRELRSCTPCLELKGDFYSLTFYGQFLDTDDEDLSSHHCRMDERRRSTKRKESKKDKGKIEEKDDVQQLIERKQTQLDNRKRWALDIKRKFRAKRNVKNFFKLIQIFCL